MPFMVRGRCFWPTIDRPYRKLMGKLGLLIGHHPLPFLVIPLCVSLSLVYPFIEGLRDYKKFAVTRAGAIELFTPVDSWSQDQKRRMERYFVDGGYFSDRTVISPTLFILLVSCKDGGTVLRNEVAVEYAQLRTSLESLVILFNNTVYDYKLLCANDKDGVKCQPDPFVTIWNLHKNGILRSITYPFVNFSDVSDVKLVNSEFYIGPLFGGVETDNADRISYAKYVRLIINLPRKNMSEDLLNTFGKTFIEYVESYRSDLLEVNYWASVKYIDDMQLISRRVVKLLPFLIGILLLFALVSCCMRDCVLSQPWLAICGIVSASLGIQCGYAVLFLLRIQLIEIAMIVPFLVLSIGVDDTFVMLNVWRHTDSNDDVATRLSHTFAEAAVSITITSITDVAAFLIGLSSVFPCVKIFCSFSACTLTTMFLFQITFFGACMVYTGRREAAGRHCLFFNKVPPISDKDGFMKRLLCLSYKKDSDKTKPFPVKPFLTLFFENHFSRWITGPKVKLMVAISYTLYIAGAVYCLVAYMVLGLQVSNLVPYNSDTHKYLSLYETYFTKCSTSAEIIIGETLRYEDPSVQERLIEMARSFEFTEFTYKVDFWLKEFLDFSSSLQTSLTGESFYHLLTNVFLSTGKYRKYSSDLSFACCTSGNNDNRNVFQIRQPYINTSRFYVEMINMGFENRSKAMHLLKSKVDAQNISLFLYDVSFPLAEQYDSILSGAVVDIVVGVGCMLLSAVVFVPNLLNCMCIAFTVLSINVGVLGYMAVCGIHLDIISLITILLSIGFSVDYTAHVAYHYHTVDDDDPVVKVQLALGTVGGPILQSSLSMLMGILTAFGVRAYIADTFIITVCLVMAIGVYHALIVLPVMLSVVAPGKSTLNGCDTKSEEFVKPDPMLKFRFMQMQRQNQAESWTQSRRPNVYKNRPITLQLKPISEIIDDVTMNECQLKMVVESQRPNDFLRDTRWLDSWIHGEMQCSGDKGKYCAYCEIVKEITQTSVANVKPRTNSIKSVRSSQL